jgi:4-carboxymuconolactone decarboxylase
MRASLLVPCFIMITAAAAAQTRFPELTPDQMNADQKAMYDAVLAGPRHSTQGPFNAWLRSPQLGDRLQRVGEYLRFNTTLPHKLNEFAILITAVEWKAGFEWYAHYPLALKAGLEPAVAKDLQEGRRPADMSADETLVYDFATQLQRQHQVSDAVYTAAVARFGEQGVVDLIALVGYYNLVSMTLNVARVPAPAGAGPTLAPPATPVPQ